MALAAAHNAELPPDVSSGYILNIVSWVGVGVSTFCVLLRIYSRIFAIQRPGWNDWMIAFSALLSVAVAYGLGATNSRRGIWFLYGIVAVFSIFTVVAVFVLFLECSAPGAAKRPFDPAHCVPIYVFNVVNIPGSALGAFVDLALAIFPAALLLNLQMKKSRKVSLRLIMGLGVM
ncbi:hypothetical protein GGR57DRAFT_507830 [Xylariaceae sp. FL1272]|nr:hypothetical protein GGR57DRAFT_507830 [Xylariaceae sp. FL1272]